MRALKIVLVLIILLTAQTGHAGLSDPGEIIENSKVDPSLLKEDSAWRKVTTTVKGWWNQGVAAVTGDANPSPAAATSSAPLATSSTAKSGEETPSSTAEISAPAVVEPAPDSQTVTEAGDATQTPTSQADATQMGTSSPVAANAQDAARSTQVSSPMASSSASQAAPSTNSTSAGRDNKAPSATGTSPVESLKASLGPSTTAQATKSSDLRDLKKQLNEKPLTHVARPARKPGANLKISGLGVPIFPMEIKQTVKLPNGKTKVVMAPIKKIPRLDVGQEPLLSREDLVLKEYKLPLTEVTDIKPLPSPELVSESVVKNVTAKLITKAEPAQDLEKGRFGIAKVISRESIKAALPKIKNDQKVVEKSYRAMTPEEEKMLTAAILFQKGDQCPMLLGLLDEMSKIEKFNHEANFELGACAQKLKMYSLGFERLAAVIRSEDPQYASSAIGLLAADLKAEYEVSFAKLVRDLKNQKLITAELRDRASYYTAKGTFKEGDYARARTFAEEVSETSQVYGDAQYLVGISWYMLGNTTKAEGKLETLRDWLATKKVADKNLNSVSAINLARMKFKRGKYKEALNLYMAIDKDHPLWVQGLVEQGWTQLAMDDFSGAIGNMYSLHSPYFKAVYKPESFVVRTIGYLNICQYGDAYRTLSWLEHDYRPWADKISHYVDTKKLASDYYETAKNYLKGKSDEDVDGLPHQIIRELARQKSFLNYQSSLNEKADEVARYDQVESQIKAERNSLKSRIEKATRRFKEVKAKLAQAQRDRSLSSQVDGWKQAMKLERELVISLRHQVEMLEASRVAYQGLRTQTLARIEKERYNLREGAGRGLVASLLAIKTDLGRVLENNEFLRYEVFSGSGENIRYQVAGGEVAQANRLPASVKPQKLLNWSFDGEYWEDEIGSYRSSLLNNCPQVGKMDDYFKNKDRGETESKGQAAIEKGEGQ